MNTLAIFAFVALAAATPTPHLPKLGSSAPSLSGVTLYGAPAEAKADWHTLKGKVVVLEFWATWCGPCVAAVPHMNALAAALDPAKFQFLAVDDEAPDVVQKFLARRPIAGWVANDPSGEIFRRFGVQMRPLTLVVDARGHVALITQPEELKQATLLDISNGKNVRDKSQSFAMPAFLKQATTAPKNATPPLLEVSITPADANAPTGSMSSFLKESAQRQSLGMSSEALLRLALDVPEDRIRNTQLLPAGKFDLKETFPVGAKIPGNAVTKVALEAAFKIKVEEKIEQAPVWVMRSTKKTAVQLMPTASSGGEMIGFYDGKLQLVNITLADLARQLEITYKTPVMDASGNDTRFDANLDCNENDFAGCREQISTALGVDLAQETREIKFLVIKKADPANSGAMPIPVVEPK